MIDAVYCINLDESKDRWTQMKQQQYILKTDIIRVPAVSYKTLPPDAREVLATEQCKNLCTDSMLAIFLSHKKTWNLVLQNGNERALILEDDCTLSPDIVEYSTHALDELDSTYPDWDLMYLGNLVAADPEQNYNTLDWFLVNYGPLKVTKQPIHCKWVYIPVIPVGLHAYVLSARGAKKMISMFDLIPQAVDIAIIQNSDSINLFATKKQLAFQMDIDSTQIQGSYPLTIGYRPLQAILFQVYGFQITGFILLCLILSIVTPVSWTLPLLLGTSALFWFEYVNSKESQKHIIYSHWFVIVFVLLLKNQLVKTQ